MQEFLRLGFGGREKGCYNFVISVRRISEVFANLLMIGILFGVAEVLLTFLLTRLQ